MRWEARRPLGGLALPGRAFCAAFHVHPAGMLPPRGCPEPWGRGQGPGERAGPRGGGERDAWLRDPSARRGARPLPLGTPSPAQRAPPPPAVPRFPVSPLRPSPAGGKARLSRTGPGPPRVRTVHDTRFRCHVTVTFAASATAAGITAEVAPATSLSPLRGVSVTRSFSPRKARVWTRAAVLFTTTPNVMGTARCPPTGDG